MARAGNLRLRLIHAAIAVALIAVVSAACGRPSEPLVLATTTSVGNSGLLDVVLPAYRNRTVRSLLVGSGRALEMLVAGQANVVISHAPAREAAILESRPGLWYRKILYNDFLIVGPATDPAGVMRTTNAVEAMRRIVEAQVRFLSRGDESGTHERERELWTLAGGRPAGDRLVIAGAGMGQTLRIASSTGAYTLTDRATFEALRNSLQLDILSSGDPRLLNTYAVLAAQDNADGLEFARWLADGDGRLQIQNALATGKIRGFSVWPAGSPADTSAAVPR